MFANGRREDARALLEGQLATAPARSNPLPWADGFEDGIDLNFDWAVSDAVATTEAPNTPQGAFSARLTGAGSMTTRDVDVSSIPPALYARLRTLHTGVPAGQSLTVEYRDFLGAWQPLGQITSDGSDQTEFTLTQFEVRPQSPQPSHTRSLMKARLGGSNIRPRLRRRRFSAAQVWS